MSWTVSPGRAMMPEKGAVARHAFVADGVFDEDDVAVVGFGVGKSEFVDEEGVAAFDGGVHGVVAHPGALDDSCRAEIECEDERDPERSECDGKGAQGAGVADLVGGGREDFGGVCAPNADENGDPEHDKAQGEHGQDHGDDEDDDEENGERDVFDDADDWVMDDRCAVAGGEERRNQGDLFDIGDVARVVFDGWRGIEIGIASLVGWSVVARSDAVV